MGKTFEELTTKQIEFIDKQNIYFVATAAESGKVNLSPKGGDSLRVIDSKKIAWLNLTGSGNESAAHVLRNSRMTIMFCAFEGAPLILRAYGNATVLHEGDAQWQSYAELFPTYTGARQIFILDIELVQASCGMSVPYFSYEGDRDDLIKWADKRGHEGVKEYWETRNQKSLDGFDTEIVERTGLTSTK